MKKMIRTTLAASMLFISGIQTSSANVFYDVTVNYAGGYQYSFGMGFANSVGIKTVANLLGGDFGEETLSRNGVDIPLVADISTGGLTFNPATLALSFFANDMFQVIGAPLGVFGNFESDQRMSFFEVPGVSTDYPRLSISVVREASGVPLPSTLWLLLAGIPALRLASKTALRRCVGSQEALPSA